MIKFNDVEFEEVDSKNDNIDSELIKECYLSAVSVAKKLDVPVSTVRVWAERYERYLKIAKLNNRMTYSEESVNQFMFIKELKEKGMSHQQIEAIVEKQGFGYGEYDGGLINTKDPLGFQALAISLSQETNKQLQQFMQSFVEHQEELNNKFKEHVIKEMAFTVDEVMSGKLDEFKNDFIIQQAEEKEMQLKTQDMINTLSEKMSERKKEYESNKTFLGRLFNK